MSSIQTRATVDVDEYSPFSGEIPVTKTEPFTPETLRECINLYARRPSKTTGRAAMSPHTLYIIQSVLNSDWFLPALLSGSVGDDLVVALMQSAVDAPKTYRTSYMRKVVLPFLEWCGKINAWEASQWRKKIPAGKVARSAIDRIPTSDELVRVFDYASQRSSTGRFTWVRDYLYLATLYATGTRATQPAYLRMPDDVTVMHDRITFFFRRLKSASDMRQRITVPFSARLPNGDYYGTVVSRYLDIMNPDASYFFYPEDDPTKMYVRPDVRMRQQFYEPLGLEMCNHALRAMVASNTASAYGTHAAQRILGHASIVTTERYVDAYEKDDSMAVVASHTNDVYYNKIGIP